MLFNIELCYLSVLKKNKRKGIVYHRDIYAFSCSLCAKTLRLCTPNGVNYHCLVHYCCQLMPLRLQRGQHLLNVTEM